VNFTQIYREFRDLSFSQQTTNLSRLSVDINMLSVTGGWRRLLAAEDWFGRCLWSRDGDERLLEAENGVDGGNGDGGSGGRYFRIMGWITHR
jgi:hypothetical protein